jgi:hypothetical protein
VTQIFLLTPGHGSAVYLPDPGNWNNSNHKIECLGSGGRSGVSVRLSASGHGGGGGAYGFGTLNITIWPVPYVVQPESTDNDQMDYTLFNSVGGPYLPNTVGAMKAGSPTTGAQSGGLGGWDYWPDGYWGGNGGDGTNTGPILRGFPDKGAGGGGAAGPSGPGTDGTNGNASLQGLGGGQNGNTGYTPAATNGSGDATWDALHGCGSGGGGGNLSANPGNGGQYGGGGGAPSASASLFQQGRGGDGLIILTYTPGPGPVRVVLMCS